jgi:hypothetical protein
MLAMRNTSPLFRNEEDQFDSRLTILIEGILGIIYALKAYQITLKQSIAWFNSTLLNPQITPC